MFLDKLILFPYSLFLSIRNSMYCKNFIVKSKEADIPTICLGNVTVGGTGKTPHTELILRLILQHPQWQNKNLSVLSMGYKRSSKKFQQVSLDGTADFYGDEPIQIKKKFPTVTVAVDKNRIEACSFLAHPNLVQDSKKARFCVNKQFPTSDIIILDDAFQYRKLKPTYSIVLVDFNRPVTRDMLLPLGELRDLPSRIMDCDSVIVTKSPHYMEPFEKEEYLKSLGYKNYKPELCEAENKRGEIQKVFFTSINYLPLEKIYPEGDTRYIYSKKLILFSGIAKDTQLKYYLSDKYQVIKRHKFGDHHKFTTSDVRMLEDLAVNHPVAAMATTEKDAQRLLDCWKVSKKLKERMFYVPIEAAFIDERDEEIFIKSLLKGIGGDSIDSKETIDVKEEIICDELFPLSEQE